MDVFSRVNNYAIGYKLIIFIERTAKMRVGIWCWKLFIVDYKRCAEKEFPINDSWGTQWGDNGYIRIVRGKTMCGVGDGGYVAASEK
ncbi:unnamed protein product [Oppiella nova]|uniref:Peptidase C1A papain C-terminal domain-containing protein n=1 Tax=Oppiella nova TaxID=334625 RepID=A0A7R9QII4_9ACAR|nr:unnamed protein product [Oppiella nova]CAG2166542.1 unnamed protein product [Oppiella nova]